MKAGENLGVGCDRGAAQRGDRHEPQEHDRPENDADARGALELDGEQRDEQPERDRDDGACERRRGHAEAFDSGEHADRRRDHAVADQEARAQHQRPKKHAGAAVLTIMQEAIEREHAALAVVLRLQHEEGVFDRDDEG